MRKTLVTLAACSLICLFSQAASAAANYVYHEQSNNFVATPTCAPTPGGTDTSAGRYVENTDRSGASGFQIYAPETYALHFKVEFQFFTTRWKVYYTTDGTSPTGNLGVGTGTTQVVDGSFVTTYQDQTQACLNVDVIAASIPPQPAGTTVRYIISAYHHGGGEEVFANSGGAACASCFKCHSGTAGCATVFQYNVLAVPATPLIISEFRLRGTNGPEDEFVEIYNNSDSPVQVQAFDGSGGFGLAASDGLVRFTIPNGTTIQARRHYLAVNSNGYSLGTYPTAAPETGGNTAAAQKRARVTGQKMPSIVTSTSEIRDAAPLRGGAAGKARTGVSLTRELRAPVAGRAEARPPNDAVPAPSAATGESVYATDIADNAGIALFNTSNPANFTTTTRLDAVGSTAEANTLYKEGAGYPALAISNNNFSLYRSLCSYVDGVACATPGLPRDTGDNATDFLFVDPSGADLGMGQRLGAPGPENSTSPVQRNSSFAFNNLDRSVSSSESPNRERNFMPDPFNNSTFGTMTLRKRVTNSTTSSVTRLRFRIIEITTHPAAPGMADLRARSSPSELAVVVNDSGTCPGGLSSCAVPVVGTTLEQASAPNDQPSGGGYNSSLSVGTVGMVPPLAPGASVNVSFLLGVQQPGRFRFLINIEALP